MAVLSPLNLTSHSSNSTRLASVRSCLPSSLSHCLGQWPSNDLLRPSWPNELISSLLLSFVSLSCPFCSQLSYVITFFLFQTAISCYFGLAILVVFEACPRSGTPSIKFLMIPFLWSARYYVLNYALFLVPSATRCHKLPLFHPHSRINVPISLAHQLYYSVFPCSCSSILSCLLLSMV